MNDFETFIDMILLVLAAKALPSSVNVKNNVAFCS